MLLIAFFDARDQQRWVSFDDIRTFIFMIDTHEPIFPDIQPEYEVHAVIVGSEVCVALETVQDVIDHARDLLEARRDVP